MGKDTYAQKVSKLKSTQAAYKAYDDAVKALASKDLEKAKQLINQAIAGEPREAKFQELLADMALLQKKPEAALSLYAKAITMQPDYFKPHVQSGIVLFSLGRKAEAEASCVVAAVGLSTWEGTELASKKWSAVPHAPKPNRAATPSQASRLDGGWDAGLEAASVASEVGAIVRGSAIH
jgi:tetratricopeptide (TPR) repeat protein